MAVAGIVLEGNAFFVVILFDPNVHIFTIFPFHDKVSRFVANRHSVGQLLTIVLCYFIFELIKLRSDHVASVIVDCDSTFDVCVTMKEVVEFLV